MASLLISGATTFQSSSFHNQSLVSMRKSAPIHAIDCVFGVAPIRKVNESEASAFLKVNLIDWAVLFKCAPQLVFTGPSRESCHVNLKILVFMYWWTARSSAIAWRAAAIAW